MIRAICACLFLAFLCLCIGCNQQNQAPAAAQVETKNDLKQDTFPEFLVGTWVGKIAYQNKWQFTFDRNGRLSSLRNFMDTYIDVSEGGSYEEPNEEVSAACMLGPVSVDYNPDGRILTVKVKTDYFMIRIQGEMAEGSSDDMITGTISEDGKTWTGQWQSRSWLVGMPEPDVNDFSVQDVEFNKKED
ncbi:MAG: hypothetical protein JW806_04905 [Sedimentisphaerales bacterium]|nr:hypothetical protein [Sedimentisphaerales bacterium]